MSFTKRTLRYDQLRLEYEQRGYKSLKSYVLKPDALFVGDKSAHAILEIFRSSDSDKTKEKLIQDFFNSN